MRFDTAFREVITACASVPRGEESGTWILPEMIEAYCLAHQIGFAHSVETWRGDELVGGLYGVSLGRMFFAESMFHLERDASKVALAALVERLQAWDFKAIDCQNESEHMLRFGARNMLRRSFLRLLRESLEADHRIGSWAVD